MNASKNSASVRLLRTSTRTERETGDSTYYIWTKKLHVLSWETRGAGHHRERNHEDEDNPVKYFATNEVDAPTEYVIHSYGMRWRIEMFFEDSKQNLGLGDCRMLTDEGVCRHWHLLMAAYSLVRLGLESSALRTVHPKASSLRGNVEYSLKKAVYNLLSRGRDDDVRGIDDLIEAIEHLIIHSTTLTCKSEL